MGYDEITRSTEVLEEIKHLISKENYEVLYKVLTWASENYGIEDYVNGHYEGLPYSVGYETGKSDILKELTKWIASQQSPLQLLAEEVMNYVKKEE